MDLNTAVLMAYSTKWERMYLTTAQERKHNPQQTINHCALLKIVFFWYLFTITVPFSFKTYHRSFKGVTDEAGNVYLPEFTFVFNGSRVDKYLFFSVGFCWSSFVFLSFFFCSLYCLSFFFCSLYCLYFFFCSLYCLYFFFCSLYCLYFFFWPLYFLSFALRLLLTFSKCPA